MTADNLNNVRVIPDLLVINENVRPSKVAYRQFNDKSKTWIGVTWKEFADMVRSWRKAFTAFGLKKGDHAAVLLPNSITATACDLSILSQGMVPVPLHAVDTPSSSAFILNNSEAKILFVPRTLRWNAMVNVQKEYPYLELVVTTGNDAESASPDSPVPVVNLSDWLKQSEKTELEDVSIDPNDLAAIVYTSGTTGKPKGVMLTHYNVVNDGKCIGDRMDLSTADRMMIQVPMFHCFGMVLSMTSCMTHGATLCPMPYFSAKVSLACINQERITCFNGVPTMFIAMFNHPDYKKTDFSYMRTGIMAGSGCPPELMRRAAQPDEMHMTDIVSVYGQTESAPGSTMSACGDPLDLRCNTVGYAFPHIECKIIDPETGEEVPDGVNGEFCSRGYNTMKGYYKMPEATAATVDKEGWLHSGDLACRDENGCYRITGRLKDMIIRGGENIYPKEIEEFIYTHPAVKDVQVIGVPDKKYGEEAMACIILKEPGSVTVEEMLDYIKASMARHKVPKYIDFVDAFPMNAAGKILKYKMREEATERFGLEGAAGIDTAQTAEQVKR